MNVERDDTALRGDESAAVWQPPASSPASVPPGSGGAVPGSRPPRLSRARLRFGPQLRAARRMREWTEAELARRAGIYPCQVSYYERGRVIPSLPDSTDEVIRPRLAYGTPRRHKNEAAPTVSAAGA